MKKVLGIILFTVFMFLFTGCQMTVETATGIGEITFEIYETDGVRLETKTVEYADGDTLLGLLRDNFIVVCEGSDGESDETCSYTGPYGIYLLAIDSVSVVGQSAYLAFYIDGDYAMTGVDATPIVDGTIYAFKYETF